MITGLAGIAAAIAFSVLLGQLQDELYYHRLRRTIDEGSGLLPRSTPPPFIPPPRKPRKRSAVAFRIGQAIGHFLARWS